MAQTTLPKIVSKNFVLELHHDQPQKTGTGDLERDGASDSLFLRVNFALDKVPTNEQLMAKAEELIHAKIASGRWAIIDPLDPRNKQNTARPVPFEETAFCVRQVVIRKGQGQALELVAKHVPEGMSDPFRDFEADDGLPVVDRSQPGRAKSGIRPQPPAGPPITLPPESANGVAHQTGTDPESV